VAHQDEVFEFGVFGGLTGCVLGGEGGRAEVLGLIAVPAGFGGLFYGGLGMGFGGPGGGGGVGQGILQGDGLIGEGVEPVLCLSQGEVAEGRCAHPLGVAVLFRAPVLPVRVEGFGGFGFGVPGDVAVSCGGVGSLLCVIGAEGAETEELVCH